MGVSNWNLGDTWGSATDVTPSPLPHPQANPRSRGYHFNYISSTRCRPPPPLATDEDGHDQNAVCAVCVLIVVWLTIQEGSCCRSQSLFHPLSRVLGLDRGQSTRVDARLEDQPRPPYPVGRVRLSTRVCSRRAGKPKSPNPQISKSQSPNPKPQSAREYLRRQGLGKEGGGRTSTLSRFGHLISSHLDRSSLVLPFDHPAIELLYFCMTAGLGEFQTGQRVGFSLFRSCRLSGHWGLIRV